MSFWYVFGYALGWVTCVAFLFVLAFLAIYFAGRIFGGRRRP